MNNKLLPVLILALASVAQSNTVTRDSVLERAGEYMFEWTPSQHNIRDVKRRIVLVEDGEHIGKYEVVKKIEDEMNGEDGLDDRIKLEDLLKVAVKEGGFIHTEAQWRELERHWPIVRVGPNRKFISPVYAYDRPALLNGKLDPIGEFIQKVAEEPVVNPKKGTWVAGRESADGNDSDLKVTTEGKYEGFTGVDCSAFVSHSLGFVGNSELLRTTFYQLPDSEKLKPGDILVKPESEARPNAKQKQIGHVILVRHVDGDLITLHHAAGRSIGSWKNNDAANRYPMRVIEETSLLKDILFESKYPDAKSPTGYAFLPYTRHRPFPYFTEASPVGYVENAQSVISVRIKGTVDNFIQTGYVLKINGIQVTPTQATKDAHGVEGFLKYEPPANGSPVVIGKNDVEVTVKTRTQSGAGYTYFEDTKTWEFHVSPPPYPYVSSIQLQQGLFAGSLAWMRNSATTRRAVVSRTKPNSGSSELFPMPLGFDSMAFNKSMPLNIQIAFSEPVKPESVVVKLADINGAPISVQYKQPNSSYADSIKMTSADNNIFTGILQVEDLQSSQNQSELEKTRCFLVSAESIQGIKIDNDPRTVHDVDTTKPDTAAVLWYQPWESSFSYMNGQFKKNYRIMGGVNSFEMNARKLTDGKLYFVRERTAKIIYAFTNIMMDLTEPLQVKIGEFDATAYDECFLSGYLTATCRNI